MSNELSFLLFVGQYFLDHGRGRTRVISGIQQRIDFRGRKMRAHFLIFEQQIAQRPAGIEGAVRGAFDELMRGRAADVLRQRNRDSLAQDQAVRCGKIVRHVLFINFEAFHHVRHMSQRACGEQKNLRQGFPFGVPAAEAAFMFLDHRGEHHGNQRRNANRGSQHNGGTHRVAFVRQGGRAAAAGFRRLQNFADFGLREQGNIARNFSQRADRQAERR